MSSIDPKNPKRILVKRIPYDEVPEEVKNATNMNPENYQPFARKHGNTVQFSVTYHKRTFYFVGGTLPWVKKFLDAPNSTIKGFNGVIIGDEKDFKFEHKASYYLVD